MTESTLPDAYSLNVSELASITLPDLSKSSQEFMTDCMLYVMDDSTRTKLMGATQPALLPAPVVDLITQPKPENFLQNFYNPTYIGLSLSRNPDYSSSFTDEQKLQLQYAASDLVMQNPEYTTINQAIFVPAAVQSSSILQKYVNDSTANWGQQLYEYVTQAPALEQVRVEVLISTKSTLYTQYVNLLSVLDPTGVLAQKYAAAVYYVHGVQPVAYGTDIGSPGLQPYVTAILPTLLDEIVSAWATLPPPDPSQKGELDLQEVAQVLQLMQQQAGGREHLVTGLLQVFTAGGKATGLADRLSRMSSNLGSSSLFKNLVEGVAGKGTGPDDLEAAAKLVRGGGALVGTLAISLSLVFAIVSIEEWDELTPDEKTLAVAQSVRLVGLLGKGISFLPNMAQAMGVVGDWASGNVLGKIGSALADFASACYQGLLNGASKVVDFLVGAVPDFLRVLTAQLGRLVRPIAEWIGSAFTAVGGFLVKAGAVLERVLKGFVVVAQLVTGVVLVYQFVNDLTSGAPVVQTVLDGVQAVVLNAVMIGDFFFQDVALAASLSFVGVLVGLGASIAEAIWEANAPPPPSAAQLYISSTVLPFVNGMLAANSTNKVPAGWAAPKVPATSAAGSSAG